MSPSLDMGNLCALAQAETLRDRLVSFLADAPAPRATIDCGRVVEADISLVQLMLSAVRTAAARGLTLDIVSSPAVDAVFARSGLAGWTANPRF